MSKFRVVTNGIYYHVQVKIFGFWFRNSSNTTLREQAQAQCDEMQREYLSKRREWKPLNIDKTGKD
jgi:hypothetical protein